jgi:hypothetical protein
MDGLKSYMATLELLVGENLIEKEVVFACRDLKIYRQSQEGFIDISR